MIKKVFLFLCSIISFSTTYAQIYSVGNDDGFSVSCYAQADNPFLAIYSVGNDDGFSVSCVGSWGFEVPLPITLLSFDATCRAEKVKLNWATTTEINNNFFTIERAIDAMNWQMIGTVDGAGNSNTVRYYTFIDEEPAEGINYYRLKQTDFNGQFEYFNIVAISCKNNYEEFTIYPNPNTGTFIIKGVEINSDVIVTDVLGQIIYKTKITTEKTEINLRQQPKGVYFVQVNTPSRWMSKKIIIN
ncbi:MAG: T9SS type A sorting domain-containing protein [Bacteroidota bacterium]